ncbi:hypothetical protein AMS68_006267 [Peltaster fructicola]|uniref:C3H1-type domain-containing protein n=1 Tax=Peltaster fructicola TaxID=286661 RepID=A0A6H0Y286_9PEZI|nr:hypothetical protein AMS68_006267 [Peltaster fructicola]
MQLDETQAQLLKAWVVKKLEDLSDTDADPDVLAEYVLELVRGDDDPAAVRQNCIDNLGDFLQDSTEGFVNDFVKALQTKAYDPNAPAPKTFAQPPSGPRKRTPVKQARRGRGGSERGGRQNQPWQAPQFQPGAMAQMNPQDAIGALMAMQQALGLPPMPGMPSFGDQNGPATSFNGRRSGKRCRDYDTKGFCARGASCKFEHGTDAMVVGSQGLDSSQAMMQPLSDRGNTRGRAGGRGRGGQGRGGGRRAEFSLAGPSQDRSLTALVVEQIPEDKFEEQQIRDFFNQYGNIQQVELQSQRRLAIVTFSSWDEANAAYTSPKVIFDNRFVKVFWYKPGGDVANGQQGSEPQDIEMNIDVPQVDPEEIAKRQAEAQKKHEELKAMDEERKKFAELLAKKANAAAQNGIGAPKVESEQTKGLKAQLAKLEAEAQILGIDPTAAAESQNGQSWGGRGGFRGRGRFTTRGSFRGAWAGAPARGGAVKRLDNRPRTLSVRFPTGTFVQYDEAMRQYLLFSDNLEHAVLSKHPDREDAAMVAFEERYRAENFKAATASGIPNIGAVEVSWMTNPANTNGTTAGVKVVAQDTPVVMADAPIAEGEGEYEEADMADMNEDSWQ